MIKDKSIFIKNIYYMLSYAFTMLNQGGYAIQLINKEFGGNRQFILCTNNTVGEKKSIRKNSVRLTLN